MKKTILKFAFSIISAVAILICIATCFNYKKTSIEQLQLETETKIIEIEDEPINLSKRTYTDYGMWYKNSYSYGEFDDFYDDTHVYFCWGTEKEKGLYNTGRQSFERLCRKKGCIHTGADCINNVGLVFSNIKNGEIVGRKNSNEYEIIRIVDYEVSSEYKSDDPIIGVWCYNNWVYYSTDYEVYRYEMSNPEKVFKVINRPIEYTYLFFADERMFFIDDSKAIVSANLDGTDEKVIVEDLVYMLELQNDRIYYTKIDDRSVYSNALTGNDERKEVDGPVWRYLVDDEGIYYFNATEADMHGTLYLKKFDGAVEPILEDIVGIRIKNDGYIFVEKERTELTDEEKNHPEDTSIKMTLFCLNLDTKELKEVSII